MNEYASERLLPRYILAYYFTYAINQNVISYGTILLQEYLYETNKCSYKSMQV